MRPGQNKRMRGRNNNGGGNRKGPNPLTRSYESNGPDVKIRGTAQHIGEKYLQLARDAQTSGDPVAAESYLQHAEHYFRLIAAAQQAQYQAQNGYARQSGELDTEDGEDEDDLVAPDRFALPSERMQPQPQPYAPQPQPYADRQNGGPERQEGQERPYRQDRPEGQERPYRQEGQERPYRQDRYGYDQQRGNHPDRQGQPQYDRGQDRGQDRNQDRNQFRGDRQDRNDRNRQRFNRDDYRDNREFRNNPDRDNRDPQYRDQPRVTMPREQSFEPRPQQAQPAVEAGPELPAFITAPVRTAAPAESTSVEDVSVSHEAPDVSAADASAEHVALRPRRRRRPRVSNASAFEGGEAQSEAPTAED